MKYIKAALLATTTLFMAGCQAQMESPVVTASETSELRFMREFGASLPPLGYISFCQREPGECASAAGAPTRVTMNSERWITLNTLNTFVNRTITPASDEEVYHKVEHWALPDNAGDCEDYVLQKRKMLIADGWPESSLLITVVRDEYGQGHAVLTAATDMGDLVLDNKTDLIRPWSDTKYVYYKRQSRSDPRRWVALTPNAQSNVALAATESQGDVSPSP